MATDTPKISFEYTVETGSFKIEVTNTTNISYTLEYDWQNVDENGDPITSTDALINSLKADEANIATDEPIAGTESSDDIYIHEVKKGVLDLKAKKLDGTVLNYKASFKITDAGTLKVISEQTTTKADPSVLGESTASAELKTTQMDVIESTPLPTTQRVAQEPSMVLPAEAAQQTTMTPVIIGSVFVGVAVTLAAISGYVVYKKRAAQRQETEPQQEVQPE